MINVVIIIMFMVVIINILMVVITNCFMVVIFMATITKLINDIMIAVVVVKIFMGES